MWSGPRNISTAMMRSWENRDDTAVWDEPLYAHFLKKRQLLANRWSQSELCVASYSAEEPSRPRWMDLEDSETRMRAEQLRRTLLGLIEEFGELPAPEDLDDPEFLEDLRRLGYL